jgi:N-acetylglutamate synthase-like GNAT family acetyltransferase
MEITFLKELLDSIIQIAQWYYAEWKGIYEASGLSFEDVKTAVAERTNTGTIPLAVVALDDKRIVGTGCLKTHDMDTRIELTPWLAGIYVERTLRRKGIGSMIVSCLDDIAKKLGIPRLYLYTPRSTIFYARLGWVENEITTYKGQHVTIMEKKLL